MQQLFLSGKGEIAAFDVPLPTCLPSAILVRNAFSLISTGTESAAVSRRGGWLGALEKACRSTDKVKQTWELARKRGVQQTWDLVRAKLEDWTMIGYSCAGQVVETCCEPTEFAPGDRVACMGTGFANHAEYVVVPTNLAVKLPAEVSYEEAAFGAVACIAQQGIRVLKASPGEEIVVIGLGLVGTLTVLQARAMGYRVYGVDRSPQRASWAREHLGVPAWSLAIDVAREVQRATGGRGADAVIVTAATRSSGPMNLALDLCRPRGRVSIVGNVGLELHRSKMYKKELEVRMSCSYGPGRYDPDYELDSRDYPLAHVRWTERRNLQFFLQLLAARSVDLRPLISKAYPLEQACEAFAHVKEADPSTYGILFDYKLPAEASVKALPRDACVLRTAQPVRTVTDGRVSLGIIGCGAFVKNVHLPSLRQLGTDFRLAAITSRTGATAATVGRRFGIGTVTSDYRVLLADPGIDAVLIATRHATHAQLVLEALQAGKHVFVEKPMCLTTADGQQIQELARRTGLVVRVGFNRRFAPYLRHVKGAIGDQGTRLLSVRVSLGSAQANHWSNTQQEGGRFLGEGVHFLDLANWMFDARPCYVLAQYLGEPSPTNTNVVVTSEHADGSVANVLYTTLGHPGLGKEHYECFGNGCAATIADFQALRIVGTPVRARRRDRGDKGHLGIWREFACALRGQSTSIGGADACAGLLATSMAQAALRSAITGARESLGFADVDASQAA